jgi:hypothetical protein
MFSGMGLPPSAAERSLGEIAIEKVFNGLKRPVI